MTSQNWTCGVSEMPKTSNSRTLVECLSTGRIEAMDVACDLNGEGEKSMQSRHIVLLPETTDEEVLTVDKISGTVSVAVRGSNQSTNQSEAARFHFAHLFTTSDTMFAVAPCALAHPLTSLAGGNDSFVLFHGRRMIKSHRVLCSRGHTSPDLGLIPRALHWLFAYIGSPQHESLYTVSVSAVQIGEDGTHVDLLTDSARVRDGNDKSYLQSPENRGCPSIFIVKDVRSAASLFDRALSKISPCTNSQKMATPVHVVFTIHLHRPRTQSDDGHGVLRSRLAIICVDESSKISRDLVRDMIDSHASCSRAASVGQNCHFCAITKASTGARTVVSEVAPMLSTLVSQLTFAHLAATIVDKHATGSSKTQGVVNSYRCMELHGKAKNSSARRLLPSASDNDYASGSEMSFNTVIFVGDKSRSPHKIPAPSKHTSKPLRQQKTVLRASKHSSRSRVSSLHASDNADPLEEFWVDGPNATPTTSEQSDVISLAVQELENVCIDRHSEEPSDRHTDVQPLMESKETQSEEPYESEGTSSTTPSTYSTIDRKGLSDISEQTDEVRRDRETASSGINDSACDAVEVVNDEVPISVAQTEPCSAPTHPMIDDERSSPEMNVVPMKNIDTSVYKSELLNALHYDGHTTENNNIFRDIVQTSSSDSSQQVRYTPLHKNYNSQVDQSPNPSASSKQEHEGGSAAERIERLISTQSTPARRSTRPSRRHDAKRRSARRSSLHDNEGEEPVCPSNLDRVAKWVASVASPRSGKVRTTFRNKSCDRSWQVDAPTTSEVTPDDYALPPDSYYEVHASKHRLRQLHEGNLLQSRGVIAKSTEYPHPPQVPNVLNPITVSPRLGGHRRKHTHCLETKGKVDATNTVHHSFQSPPPHRAVIAAADNVVTHRTSISSATTQTRHKTSKNASKERHKESKFDKIKSKASSSTQPIDQPVTPKVNAPPGEQLVSAVSLPAPIATPSSPYAKRFSPYNTVTLPRHSMHSSSGHGSDCSSLCAEKSHGCRRYGGGASSGYESVIRDSEISSHNDSTSESSVGCGGKLSYKGPLSPSQAGIVDRSSIPEELSTSDFDTLSNAQIIGTLTSTPTRGEKDVLVVKINDLLSERDSLTAEIESTQRLLHCGNVEAASLDTSSHFADRSDRAMLTQLNEDVVLLRKRLGAYKACLMMESSFVHNKRTTNNPDSGREEFQS